MRTVSDGLKIRIAAYSNDRVCDCGKGMMRPTGVAIMTHPPRFPHECNAGCGRAETLDREYPYLSYEGE